MESTRVCVSERPSSLLPAKNMVSPYTSKRPTTRENQPVHVRDGTNRIFPRTPAEQLLEHTLIGNNFEILLRCRKSQKLFQTK